MRVGEAFTRLILCLAMLSVLAGCAGRSVEKRPADIVLEPDATKKDSPVLTPVEIAALRSTGELDRNLSSTAMADVTREFIYYLREGRKHMRVSAQRSGKYLPGVFPVQQGLIIH